ncbi:MAG: class I SAM-dependent methyltransferase family protein [Candidatus Bathyarchaeia archaeon]
MRKRRLRDVLIESLEPKYIEKIYNSYDVIGDIAIIRLNEELIDKAKIVAEAIAKTQKRVKTVLMQTSPVSNVYRTRKLEWILGEKRTETEYREFGCIFKVDLAKVYFSPRLSNERMRIAKKVEEDEVIVNMFAGVGTYSIIIAKHSKPKNVFSIDLNPEAVKYMEQNILINKVSNTVIPILGDAKEVIKSQLQGKADRVLMPLPEKAIDYLDSAVLALKPTGGWIHYYSFKHGRAGEALQKAKDEVSEKLSSLNVSFEVDTERIVRETGPNWYQVALDIKIRR